MMLLQTREGREVEVTEIDGDIGEGAWVVSALYTDDGTDVDDDDVLNNLGDDNQDEVYLSFYERCCDRANRACEGER